MKKIIIAIVIVLVIAIALLLVFKNKKTETVTEEPEVVKYDNDYYDLSEGLQMAFQETNLGIPLEEEINYTQIDESINLDGIENVSSATVGRYNAETFVVASITKVTTKDDEDIVLGRIDEYINELKQKYSDIKIAMEVLNNKDNIKIYNEDGIVFFVIAPDASAIMGGLKTTILRQANPSVEPPFDTDDASQDEPVSMTIEENGSEENVE